MPFGLTVGTPDQREHTACCWAHPTPAPYMSAPSQSSPRDHTRPLCPSPFPRQGATCDLSETSLRSFPHRSATGQACQGCSPGPPFPGSAANLNESTAVTNRQPLEEILQGVFEDSQVELPGIVERKNKLSFVVSDEELEILNTARGGMKLSEYLRAVIFKQRLPIPRATVPAINRETLVQLNRIGGLLNQQATALNTAKRQNSFSGISLEYLKHCLDKLEQLDQELKQLGRAQVQLNAGIRTEDDCENF